MMDRAMELPTWLYDMSYGLAHYQKLRVLIDGKRFAIVQSPGENWSDNSGVHYGLADYWLVDKSINARKGYGLLDQNKIQHGGRAKVVQWREQVKEFDAHVENFVESVESNLTVSGIRALVKQLIGKPHSLRKGTRE